MMNLSAHWLGLSLMSFVALTDWRVPVYIQRLRFGTGDFRFLSCGYTTEVIETPLAPATSRRQRGGTQRQGSRLVSCSSFSWPGEPAVRHGRGVSEHRVQRWEPACNSAAKSAFAPPVANLNAAREPVYFDRFIGHVGGMGVANPRRQGIVDGIDRMDAKDIGILGPKSRGSGLVLLGFRGAKMEGVSQALQFPVEIERRRPFPFESELL